MADRTVTTRLRLDVAQFIAGETKAKGALGDLNRQFAQSAGAAEGFRKKLEASFKALPKIKIDADSSPAEVKVAELRAKLQTLASKKIGVDIDTSAALVEMATIQAELETIQRSTSFEVRADVSKALAEIESVVAEVQRLDDKTVNVDVEVGGGAFAEKLRSQVEAAARSLPKIPIDADSTPAQQQIADLRTRLETLGGKRVGIDIDAAAALAELRAIQSELSQIDGDSATIDIRVDAAAAASELAVVSAEVSSLDGRTANVQVNADVAGALAGIQAVGIALAGLAAVPALASLSFGAAGLGAAFGAAGAGAAGFAAVAVPSLGRINEALQQQESAAGGAGGATKSLAASQAEAASRALQHAQALNAVRDAAVAVTQAKRALQSAIQDVTRAQDDERRAADDLTRAIEDGSQRHIDALRQVESAERSVGDAQRDALRAQQDLNDARAEEARSLEDLGNRLIDTQIDQRQAALDLNDAQAQLNATLKDPRATKEQKERAQINYDRAVQRVKELELSVQRLQSEQAQADKNGIEGSKRVQNAKDAVEQANRRLQDSERDLADARANVAKVDEDSARRVADAQRQVADAHRRVADAQAKVIDSQERLAKTQREAILAAQRLKLEQLQAKAAMEQTGGAAGGAITKMAQLSKAEQALAKDLKAFKDGYIDWQRSLQPDVFPVISKGLDLISSALPKLNPLVKAGAQGFSLLEDRAKTALADPFWDDFIAKLSKEIPDAIDDFGAASLNVGKGLAGIVEAFLPHAGDLTNWVVDITKRFSDWGTGLETSPGFKNFVAYAQTNFPKVQLLVENLGIAVGKILSAAAAPGQGALDFLVGLSQKLADLSPEQIQAVAGGVASLFAAAKLGSSLKIAAILGLADVLDRMSPGQIQAVALAVAAVVVAVKGAQTVSAAIGLWDTLKGKLDDVGGAAGTTSGRLASIGKAAGIAGGILIAAGALHEVAREASGANISVDGLGSAFDRLQKTGRITGDLATAFGKDLKGAGLLVDGFGDGLRRNFDPTIFDNMNTAFKQTISNISGGIVNIDPFLEKLKEVDQTLANMVDSGNVAGAQEGFRLLAKEAKDAGIPIEVLKAQLPEYANALGSATTRTDTAAIAMQGMAGATDTARQAADDYTTALTAFSQKTDAAAALQGLKKDYDDVKAAVDAANGKLDLSGKMTDKQRDAIIKARDQFSGYIGKVDEAAKKQSDLARETGNSAGAADAAKAAILRQLPQLFSLAGKSSEAKDAVYKLAQQYGISREQADKATKSAKDLRDMLAQLKSKEIKISVKTEYQDDLSREALRQASKKSDGGIMRYAEGGLRAASGDAAAIGQSQRIQHFAAGAENHVAEIAPANTIRVWAEPETQGESYIPLAPSKRARSTEILAATANIFGYQLMPAGKLALIAMANGGLVAGGGPTPVMSTGTATGGLVVSIDNLGGFTASLDQASQGLNQQLAGAAGLLGATLGETGTLTKQVIAVGKMADTVAKSTTAAAGTTSSSTAKLTAEITKLSAVITKLTAAVAKAGTVAKTSAPSASGTSGGGSSTTKKPVGKPKAQGSALTENDARAVKKPTNQIDGSSGSGGSNSIVGEAAYAGSMAGVQRAASAFGQSAGAAFGSVMAASASRSLPIHGPGGAESRTEAPAVRRSAPQMGGGGVSYSGVYGAGAAQQGSLAGRLAHEAAGGSPQPQQQPPALVVEHYHESPRGSVRETAEELSYLGRRGG